MRCNYQLSLWFFFMSVYVVGYQEKPIVVIVPSYNNQQWYKHNIDSIACQKYDNYRVMYINDCSSDTTGELVYNYIQQLDISDRITFIDNKTRRGALANLYSTIHSCADYEIIVTLDGDDWFASDQTLARINQAYQDENVWLTYGQFKTYPQDTVGFCREMPPGIVQGNLFREYEWITSHPRTFYAALFKQVQLKDLLYEGDFFDVTWDMAFMYPMLEMSAGHFRFIPDVLYVYNQGNTLNDFRQKVVRQIRCKYHVSSKDKYARIASLPYQSDISVELLILSDNTPAALEECLANTQQYLNGIDALSILYRADSESSATYQQIKDKHKYASFGFVDDASFKKQLLALLASTPHSYVLFIDDSARLYEACDMHECAYALQQTKAHAFYGALSTESAQKIPPMVSIVDGMMAWQFKYGEFAFKRQYGTHMVLYKKDVIQQAIETISCTNKQEMIQMLNDMQSNYEQVGLCFEHSKIKGNGYV